MTKFRNTYRIESARLQTWDYSSQGSYFITICTKDRECYFGEIIDAKMQLSTVGRIAESEWLKTPELRPDMNLELGEFIVMPNHIHGIIFIGENPYNHNEKKDGALGKGPVKEMGRDAMHRVSAIRHDANKNPKTKFGPHSKNLASIVRGYKSAVTIWARKNQMKFGWQERFHDHIIRSMDDYDRISEYIHYNPANWEKDPLNVV